MSQEFNVTLKHNKYYNNLVCKKILVITRKYIGPY